MVGAAGLRLWLLSDAPPGITHDEADHGLSAWGVVNGVRPLYFTVGYGREPLYDYATALLMSLIGSHYLASRFTSVFFSLVLLAATYTWTKSAFNRQIALLTVAGLAFSFWGVMVGRHALRTVTMPALFTLSMALYWRGIRPQNITQSRWMICAGIVLGATFYTYIPARIMWLLFPALLLWWQLTNRAQWQRAMRPTLIMLTVAGLIALPLFYHLQTTGAEQRLDQLSGPIDALLQGDWRPLWHNIVGALKLFTVAGDDGEIMWRYNIPGRPFLTPIMGVLFYIGLAIALWKTVRQRHTSSMIALIWLAAGLAPALITGPEGSTTRAAAMMPVLYLFPALAIDQAVRITRNKGRTIAYLCVCLLFTLNFLTTADNYFNVWANEPEVRIQYETTRITALNWVNANGGTAALSSPNPNRFHDPAMEVVTVNRPDQPVRWFNGAHSLVLPDTAATNLLFSAWADERVLTRFVTVDPTHTLPLDENDLDRPITIYTVDTRQITADLLRDTFTPTPAVQLGDYAILRGYHIEKSAVQWRISTLWQVIQPVEGLTFFTNLFDPVSQTVPHSVSRLDAPSYYWQPGDHFIQSHDVPLPAAPGRYPIYVGAFVSSADNAIIPILNSLNANEYELTIYEQP